MQLKCTLGLLVFATLASSQTITVTSGDGQLVPAGLGQGSTPISFLVLNGDTPVPNAQITIVNPAGGFIPLTLVTPVTDANGVASTVFVLGEGISSSFSTYHFRASLKDGNSVDFYETAVNSSTVTLSGPQTSLVSPYKATAGQPGPAISVSVFAGQPIANTSMVLTPAFSASNPPPAGATVQSIGCLVDGQTIGYALTDASGQATCSAVFSEPNNALTAKYDNFSFYVVVGGAYRYGPFAYQISPLPPSISAISPQMFSVNAPISEAIGITGGLAPFTLSAAAGSNLPSGIVLGTSGNAGSITGSISAPGIYAFQVQVTDSLGQTSTPATVTLDISNGTLSFTPAALPAGILHQSYSQTLAVAGGVPPYQIGFQSLPPGLTGMTTDSVGDAFVISGTPTMPGTFTFNLAVTDSAKTSLSKSYTITVVNALALAAPVLPVAVAGASYSFTLVPSGGVAPYSFSSNNLPPGFSISAAGVITGSPTGAAGLYTVTFNVSDAAKEMVSVTAMFAVSGGTLGYASPVTLPAGAAGQLYSATVPGPMGGVPPYSFALTGTPPAGVTLSSAGLLSGTFVLSGPQSISFTVTDAAQETTSGTLNVTLSPSAMSLVSSAGFNTGPVSPGELVTFFGTGIGPTPGVSFTVNAGTVATSLGSVQVLFGSTPAALLYVSATQVNAIVPFEVAVGSTVPVVLSYGNLSSTQLSVAVVDAAPGIFTIGNGQGAILNSDYSVNSAANPATPGKFVQIYATGGSIFTPTLTDGAIVTLPSTQNVPDAAVYIGGQSAQVLYAGAAPGLVAGVLVINALVPVGTPAGSAVPIAITVGADSSSVQTVTLAVGP